MELSSLKLKDFPIFQEELPKTEKQKFYNFCLLRENFSNISTKEKNFLYFSFKEAKFSKSKYFLIIIIKRFFSFYNIFCYTKQAFVFHLLVDFCIVYDHIVAFFLFLP